MRENTTKSCSYGFERRREHTTVDEALEKTIGNIKETLAGSRALTEDPFSDASGDPGATREAPRGHSADYRMGSHTASSANRERVVG